MNTNLELLIFCKNIKFLRKKYKYTKREMARILGIGVISLSLIEIGKLPKHINCDVIFKINLYFGIEPSKLFSPLNK